MSRDAERLVAAAYVLLALLAWGLFAFEAALWQDDAYALARALSRDDGLDAHLGASETATRRLMHVFFRLAVHLPRPQIFLRVLDGAMWLALGFLADRLARRLFTPRAWVGFFAGSLTLCATGDALTGSLVGFGYHLLMVTFFAALLALLRWCDGGRGWNLAASVALVGACVWTAEVALPFVAMTPLLLWSLAVPWRRIVWAGSAWLVALVPNLAALALGEFAKPDSYLQRAQLEVNLDTWLARSWSLFRYNFTPWRWVEHPAVFASEEPAPVFSGAVYWGASILGVVVFAAVASTLLRQREGAEPFLRGRLAGWPVLLWLVVATLLINAIFAAVHQWQFLYRTHLISRLWASLVLVGLAARWVPWRPGLRRLALLVPASFVALGIWGGIERQDYFFAIAQRHRAELASILDAAPSLAPGAVLVLQVPPNDVYLATEADYLARSWAVLLYKDPGMAQRTLLWSSDRRTGCRPRAGGLQCWQEAQVACFAAGTCPGLTVPYERLVVLSLESDGRYQLVHRLDSLLGSSLPAGAQRYEPWRNLAAPSSTAWSRSLLAAPRLLGHRLSPRPQAVRGGG